ncbi:hypothetical protein V6N13_117107 [Hibiscus sabdariffa]
MCVGPPVPRQEQSTGYLKKEKSRAWFGPSKPAQMLSKGPSPVCQDRFKGGRFGTGDSGQGRFRPVRQSGGHGGRKSSVTARVPHARS